MIAWKRAIALSMLTAVPIFGNANCSSSETWIGSSSNGWNDANWSPGCIPGQAITDTDIAIFAGNVGAFGSTISLDTPAPISPGLSQLIFDNATTSFNISSPSGTNHLHFNGLPSSGLYSFLTNDAGTHILSNGLLLNSTILNIQNNDPNGSLTVFDGLNTIGISSLILTGPGAFFVQNNNTAAAKAFTVSGTITTLSGTFSNINSAATAAGNGSQVSADNGFNIDGGNAFLSNIGAISGSCGSFTGATSGDFIVKAGTLTLFNNGAITGTPSHGTQIAGPVALIIGGGLVRTTNIGTVAPNTVALPNSGTFVEFNQLIMTGGQFVNSGPLSSSPAAIGNLISIANETILDGGTLINDDTFRGGTLLGIQVFPGATLSGTGLYQGQGAVQNLIVSNAGTVNPQNANGIPGTMTIQGAYAQTSDGTLIINMGAPGSTGLLNVTSNVAGFGTAELGGKLILNLSPNATFPLHTNIPIITTSNGLIGNFSRIVNNIPNLAPTLTVDPNKNLLVSFAPKLNPAHRVFNFSQVIFSKMNQKNMRIQNYIWRMVRTIQDNEFISSTYPCAAIKSSTQSRMVASAEPSDYASDPKMIASKTSIGGPYAMEFSESALIAGDPSRREKKKMTAEQELQELLREIQGPPIPNPADIYFGPTFSVANTVTKKGQVGSTSWSAGATAGYDYAFPVGGIGITADYSHTKGFTKHHGGTYTTDGADLSVYGAYVPPSLSELSLSAIVGGGYQWNFFPSDTGFPGMPLVAKGFPHGWDYNINLSGQFMFLNNMFPQVPQNLQFGIITGLQYCYSFTEGYTEHGAGFFDTKYFPSKSNSLRTNLGFIICYIFQWNIAYIVPQLSIDWQRECLKQSSVSKSVPANTPDVAPTLSPSFGPGRNYMDVSFDMLTMFYNQYGVDINWGFEWNDTSHDHSFMLSGKFKF